MDKIIIGIAGQAAAGKDTLADFLIPEINKLINSKIEKASFAGNVKKIFANAFGVTHEFIEEWKRISSPPPNFLIPVRKGLQLIGDGFRQIKSDVWIDFVLSNPLNNIIISDVRYCNEAIKIKQKGGLNILIYRANTFNNDDNDSEKIIGNIAKYFENKGENGIINFDENYPMFDYFIQNDGTLDDLKEKATKHLLPFIMGTVFK